MQELIQTRIPLRGHLLATERFCRSEKGSTMQQVF